MLVLYISERFLYKGVYCYKTYCMIFDKHTGMKERLSHYSSR